MVQSTANMSPAIPGVLATTLYVAAAAVQISSLVRTAPTPPRILLPLTSVGALAHALTVYLVMNHPDGIDLGLLSVASLVSLAIVAFTLAASAIQPLQNLLVIVLPLATAMLVGSLLVTPEIVPRSAFSAGLLTHVLLSLLAYTVLALAACQALVLAAQEHLLRSKSTLLVLRLLPPLETMESVLFQQIWVGILLLTASIASGFLFLNDMFAQRVVHHTVLASASWLIFLVLLIGRHAFGWRGTTASRWTLTGFTCLVLAYFGSKFVIEYVLGGA
jgi:ABC-type uncharacterized transport system permease subunit